MHLFKYRSFYQPNERGQDGDNHQKESKAIVDLDTIVENWIRYMWDKTKTKQDSKYDFEDLGAVVNWDKVEIVQDEARFDESRDPHTNLPKTQTLFRTIFTNRTDQEQEYSFKTERTTRQTCSFSFIKGFSREKEGSISFKIPQDIVEIGGGIKTEQSIECGKDQTKEQEVTWGVDSMIKVKPHSRTCASLVITELELTRKFSVDTRLRGRLIVSLNNRKEHNQFVKSFSGDIVEIINKAMEKYWLPSGSCIFEIININDTKYARTTVKGKCDFRLGVEQHVTLNEENID